MKRPLRRDEAGSVAVEMALILPVLLLMVMGAIELALSVFVGQSNESAMLEASRYGQTGSAADGETRMNHVRDIIAARTYGLLDLDEVGIEALVYSDYEDIGAPEPFEDANGNGAHDPGESYTDANGNGQWDADMGLAGLGGAGDIVLYRITYDWGLLTPLVRSVMGESIRQVSAVTIRTEEF